MADGSDAHHGGAGARRDRRALRRRARLPQARPAVGARGASPDHRDGALADGGARADASRPRAPACPRSVVAPHTRIDGRALEPRALPLALRARRSRSRADHQLHGRHRDLRRHPRVLPDHAAQAVLLRRPHPRNGRRRVRREWPAGARPGRRAGGHQDVARDDARVLARSERYEETYWSRWPGVWVHGDWALIDADGFWFLQGRSDDTLKIAGKRLGPAEVESILVGHPAVAEAGVIGVPPQGQGEAAGSFVV